LLYSVFSSFLKKYKIQAIIIIVIKGMKMGDLFLLI